jgi:hypothetical protein
VTTLKIKDDTKRTNTIAMIQQNLLNNFAKIKRSAEILLLLQRQKAVYSVCFVSFVNIGFQPTVLKNEHVLSTDVDRTWNNYIRLLTLEKISRC